MSDRGHDPCIRDDSTECDCSFCQADEDRFWSEQDGEPHTHVYVGTDRGDECEVCGRLASQFSDLPDEMRPNWDGAA